MPASYPAIIRDFSTKKDFQDDIAAQHFNGAQEELVAMERVLGIMPQRATNNPAKRTPDYGTVTSRTQELARKTPFISYRAASLNAPIQVNTYFRPALTVSEDTHQMADATGFTIPQTGYWVITGKADWQHTAQSAALNTTRTLSLEINGQDVGLRDVLVERDYNRSTTVLDGSVSTPVNTLSNRLTWQETLVEGTHISLALMVTLADTTKTIAPVNAYLRAYLVRCDTTPGGIPNPVFLPDPPPPQYNPGPVPTSKPYSPFENSQPPASSGIVVYTYDSNGNYMNGPDSAYNPYYPPYSGYEPTAWPQQYYDRYG